MQRMPVSLMKTCKDRDKQADMHLCIERHYPEPLDDDLKGICLYLKVPARNLILTHNVYLQFSFLLGMTIYC